MLAGIPLKTSVYRRTCCGGARGRVGRWRGRKVLKNMYHRDKVTPMRTGKVYGLRDRSDRFRYVGSSCQTLLERLHTHKHAARADPLCCPLYRECGGDGLAGWTIVQLAEVTYDPE
eukprot:COSAG04_NODE_5163_length_1717_cov_1.362176_1_plen_115_part_10